MDKKSSLPQEVKEHYLWQEIPNRIHLSTRISLHRNVNGFPFPSKIQPLIAKELAKDLSAKLESHLKNPKTLYPHNLAPIDREYLFEHYLLTDSYEKFDESRSILVSPQMRFIATMHLDDHLTMHLCSNEQNIQQPYNFLSSIETEISIHMPFSYSNRFGYLTTDPFLAGTGLIVEPILHLPALIHTNSLLTHLENIKDVILFPGFGKEDDYVADVVILENKYKLGLSEESILQEVEKRINYLVDKEKAKREELKKNPPRDLQDKIARANALIHNAKQLSTEETLSAISLLELAYSLNWVKQEAPIPFQKMFFSLRRGHLLSENLNLSIDEVPSFRASFIQNLLKDLNITLQY